MSNRICSFGLALFLALFVCFARAPVLRASAAPISDAADAFLRELGTPEPIRAALTRKIESGGESGERISGVVESDSGVYSFSCGASPKDRDADVQNELEIEEADYHVLRARHALVIHLVSGRLDRKRYHYDDALDGAVLSLYKRGGIAGLQSASDIVGDWVMALVWFRPEAARAAREAMPETEVLNENYCSILYDRAKNLFDGGRYSEALPVFKHIHDFKWANIGAYTDAAECFLRTGEPEECLKLLRELVDTLGENMSSDDFARAGRLFREAGDRESALGAFQEARALFRQGK